MTITITMLDRKRITRHRALHVVIHNQNNPRNLKMTPTNHRHFVSLLFSVPVLKCLFEKKCKE